MTKLLGIIATVVLAGCATSSKTYGPDGREAYSLNCSGAAMSWGACESKAGDICGARGYTIVSRGSDQSAMIGGAASGFGGSSSANRSMLVQCK